MALLDLLGRRWSLRLLWEMRDQNARTFRELQALLDAVSPSVLNTRLSELRAAGLVVSDDQGYRLTAQAIELMQSFEPLVRWSQRWARNLERRNKSS
jgi:DNA-binding HxlR family transcriptional regulator